jgi:hypothetical protein
LPDANSFSSSYCSPKSIFAGLPEKFEVARYHSLHGIKDRLPKELEVTALSEDGIVMGIQHSTLPFAAVQFHPESILTSPANGMAILENTLRFVKYNDGKDDLTPETGSALVGKFEKLSIAELQEQLEKVQISTGGTKSELVIRLALWTHKSKEAKAGRIDLTEMTVTELQELKQGLGLKGAAPNRPELLELLNKCLLDAVAI